MNFEKNITELIQKAKNEIISGERIYLRCLTEDDVSEKYVSWLNDSKTTKYLITKQTTLDELIQYVNEKYSSPTTLFWGIYCKKNGLHVGNIKLEPIDIEKNEATLGILVGDKSKSGKGICTETVQCILNYGFNVILLNSISLGVKRENFAAQRCYKKCGFNYVLEQEEDIILHIENSSYRMKINSEDFKRQLFEV